MKRKLLALAVVLCVCAIPLRAVVSKRALTNTLKDLRVELQTAYQQREETQKRFNEDYELQRQRMLDIVRESNEISLMLYTQEEEMTFDLAYALQKVTAKYNDFSQDRHPYDRIVEGLHTNIDRYNRLIEALLHNDPNYQHNENDSASHDHEVTGLAHEHEAINIEATDTAGLSYLLDEEGLMLRDTCIFLASELLKMHVANHATVVADSTHYQESYLRLKEAYDYTQLRYQKLQNYIFLDGQTPYMDILANPGSYWEKAKADMRSQYDIEELSDSIKDDETPEEEQTDESILSGQLSNHGEKAVLLVFCIVQLFLLSCFWLASFVFIWILNRLIARFTRFKKRFAIRLLMVYALLIGTVLYFFIYGFFWNGDEMAMTGVRHINTLLWLLIVILGSLLLRVPDKIRHGLQLYSASFMLALFIISCRIIFIPDKMLVFLLPPILLVAIIWQLFFSIRYNRKADQIDSTLGWISLAIYVIALIASFSGYTFVALLIMVWWYFQLAALLTIFCIYDLLNRYKARWLDKRVEAARNRITYVTGDDRESLLFGTTWFYELMKQMAIPAVLLSLPWCISLSLDIFDFDTLFYKFYYDPFVQLFDKDGIATLCISVNSIIRLIILFYVLRYCNQAIHTIWQHLSYKTFMRKHHRNNIRANEINLSLGNSIISVLLWMGYAAVVIITWKIPTGSLGLIAGGLSAGIGLALKDVINNLIYGIQLMGGRLRVGDWIECDGVRGKVSSINYQCVQIETIEGTEMSFLNASLFGKNFNNLTRNNSYELTTIPVGVAYGTEVKQVREVLNEAMQKMRTKDHYGREIVDPNYGFNVVVGDMKDSSVEIDVKQYVLVAERIAYVERAKEVIYDALTAAGITFAFPQCDVHLIQEE
ncbi:MAG: mechanosensitive ion channel [Bacteroidaceae bacterium]|nr:mechanosensitive ion channel [Bacteroidaceae bacterium]